jgi:hypothetical protein
MRALSFLKGVAIFIGSAVSVGPLLVFSLTSAPFPRPSVKEIVWGIEEASSSMMSLSECAIRNARLYSVQIDRVGVTNFFVLKSIVGTNWSIIWPYDTNAQFISDISTSDIFFKTNFSTIDYFKAIRFVVGGRGFGPNRSNIYTDIERRPLTNILKINSRRDGFNIPAFAVPNGWRLNHKPCPVGEDGRIFGVIKTLDEPEKGQKGDNSGKDSYHVKSFGFPDLPIPESLLFGPVLGGWLVGVVGVVVLALPMIPYFVEFFSYVFGLRQW